MNATRQFLEEVKQTLTLTSDYQLAKALDTSVQNVSRYMLEKSQMDVYTCCRVAEVLQVDPLKIIAAVELDREKDVKKQAFWEGFLTRHCKTIVGAVLAIGLLFGMSAGHFDPTMINTAMTGSMVTLLYIIYAMRQ